MPCCGLHPLSVEELAEVLAVDFSAKGGTPMVSSCVGRTKSKLGCEHVPL